ncbi:MAG: DUF2802 domain-containing protein [Bdellovibrionales bacterium]
MSAWLIFFQMVVNIGLLLGLFLIWARTTRPPKEDARLSKGLQLLQSKISILEDLSDRTDVQVRQLTALLASKVVEVQQKINESDRQIVAIEKSMEKSLEVSKIFQDKIPHREIIERENSYKYIEAARMAHKGVTADQISQQLAIPQAEAQIIVNMNRDRLIVSDSEIPPWAQALINPETSAPTPPMPTTPSSSSFSTASFVQDFPVSPLKNLGEVEQMIAEQPFVDIGNQEGQPLPPTPNMVVPPAPPEPRHFLQTQKNKTPQITPYEFPKINPADKKYI